MINGADQPAMHAHPHDPPTTSLQGSLAVLLLLLLLLLLLTTTPHHTLFFHYHKLVSSALLFNSFCDTLPFLSLLRRASSADHTAGTCRRRSASG
jgi:hypothetical protein